MSNDQLTRPELPAYQQRVVEEFGDICNKIEKLRVFICGETYSNLCAEEKMFLCEQLDGMITYADALNGRLVFWGVFV